MASPLLLPEYDVVICGGGTAGCVLAARLSEEAPNLQILLLEAGEEANDQLSVYIPGLFATNFESVLDWNYISEPSSGLNMRRIGQPRGKCIGGSSAINFMALIYPSKASVDAWEEAGNEGWGWEGMAKYFKKFTTFVAPSEEVARELGIDYLDSPLVGTSGPIRASFPQGSDPLQTAWVNTWKGLGMMTNPIDGIAVGGCTTPAAIDPATGRRSFAGSAYYAPAKERANLHVVTYALVDRLELETGGSDGVRATGVRFSLADGTVYCARASREVVLCSGTFGSPAILERSGIGSRELCEKLGIACLVDNPDVGENLQDHLMVGPSYEVVDGVVTADCVRDPASVQTALQQYQESHSGPLAVGPSYSFAHLPLISPLNATSVNLSIPDLISTYCGEDLPSFYRKSFLSSSESPASTLLIKVQFHAHRDMAAAQFRVTEEGNYVSFVTQLGHPLSRGSSHVVSASAAKAPRICPEYFSHPLDAEIMARHVLQCEALARLQPLASFLKPGGRRLPSPAPLETVEDAVAYVRANATTMYHPCGTCAMGPARGSEGTGKEGGWLMRDYVYMAHRTYGWWTRASSRSCRVETS